MVLYYEYLFIIFNQIVFFLFYFFFGYSIFFYYICKANKNKMTVNDLISRLKIELSDIVLSNDERYLITLFESNLSVVYKRYLNTD